MALTIIMRPKDGSVGSGGQKKGEKESDGEVSAIQTLMGQFPF